MLKHIRMLPVLLGVAAALFSVGTTLFVRAMPRGRMALV
jgi:hypothetical protein